MLLLVNYNPILFSFQLQAVVDNRNTKIQQSINHLIDLKINNQVSSDNE